MKLKMKLFLSFFSIVFLFYSCGGTGGGSSSTSSGGFNYNTAPVKIAFDPNSPTLSLPIPLPNDANSTLLQGDNQTVKFDIDPNADNSTKMLYTALNYLKLKGLPANTFVAIPLNVDEQLDITSLYQNIFLLPFSVGVVSASGAAIVPVAGPENLIIKQEENVIKIIPKKPLLGNSQYALIIKKGIKTADGDLVGHDPSMELLLKDKENGYGLLVANLEQMGVIKSDDILAISTFTTAHRTLKLSAFSKLMYNLPLTDNDTISYDNITGEFQEIISAASLFSLMSNVDNDTSGSYATLTYLKTSFKSFDVTTLSTTKTQLNVPVIILPNVSTNKVVIFQHGLGGDKTHVFALAQKFLQAGFTIVSMDLPWHGERIIPDNLSFDCNGDNKTDSGECFLTANLVQDRINFYQAVFDMTMLLKDLKSGKFDLNGDNVTDNVNDIYFVGISLGSITGSMFATYNANELKKVALTVGGADLSTIIDGTAITSIQESLKGLGLTKGSGEYYTFLGIVHLILDPADPLYNVNNSIKDKTIVITANGDNIVPNTSNEILSSVLGYSAPTVYTSFDNLSSNAGWYQYGGNEYKVPHAFLLSVDNASAKYGITFDDAFIDEAHDKVQDQIINFFNN